MAVRSAANPRSSRRRGGGATTFRVGLVALVVIVAGTYLGFSKHIPFTHGFLLKAVVPSANSIRLNSFVRIAGVNVGKVKAVERQPESTAAVVTMDLEDIALPIHQDATLQIRPRIFLEGNFFVDLKPGTPSAKTIESGYTLPITQASFPVQLDQVLTALQSDTRQDLQDFLRGYGEALTSRPTSAEDATQDPSARGLTGAKALNRAFVHGGAAFKNGSIVNAALLGTEPHDLSRLIAGLGKTAKGLDTHEAALKDLITSFDRTMRATAAEATALRSTIRALPGTLSVADSALISLDRALPSTRAFAREILPGVRQTRATIDASFPWIAQARALLGPTELRGLARDLRPATADLARATDGTIRLLPQVDLIDRCLLKVVLPTGDIKIRDGALSTNTENYKEFWYTFTGLSGETQNSDGNGAYTRFQPGGGSQTLSLGRSSLSGQNLLANPAVAPAGVRPQDPGRRPPYRPDVPCYTQKSPDLNGPAANRGPADGSRASGGGGTLRSAPARRKAAGGGSARTAPARPGARKGSP